MRLGPAAQQSAGTNINSPIHLTLGDSGHVACLHVQLGDKCLQAGCEYLSCYCRPAWLQRLPSRVCALLLKAAVQTVLLLHCLFFQLPKPDVVLVQSPPAIPTLMLCVAACWWHHAKLVLDWHNFGYTIMSMTMGSHHPLVLLFTLSAIKSANVTVILAVFNCR